MDAPNSDDRAGKRPGRHVYREACGKPAVYFCRHALDRMKQRGISEGEVFEALNNPDKTGLPTANYRVRKHNAWNRSARTSIHVIFEVLPDSIRVVTAYDLQIDDATGEPAKAQKRSKSRQRRPGRRGPRR